MLKPKEIKVGSLVEVGPTFQGLYIVVHAGDPDPLLEDDPVLYDLDSGHMGPMARGFIKVLSE